MLSGFHAPRAVQGRGACHQPLGLRAALNNEPSARLINISHLASARCPGAASLMIS